MKNFPVIPGCELYLCGGSCRDYILKKPAKDRDFVVITEHTFDELVDIINSFPNSQVFLAKKEFNTIRCKIDHEVIDLVFPRLDGEYTDGRHPNYIVNADSLEADSTRRDFTMNAMYIDKYGILYDFHNGEQHIKNKIIYTVGDANKRFQEDYLRILRAVRFSCQLDFDISTDVLTAMKLNAHNLSLISTERIMDELNRSFIADPEKTIKYINYLSLYNILQEKRVNFLLTNKQL